MAVFRIATYNVNSIRSRLHILMPWLRENRPDVICLQETKVADGKFPQAEFADAGYHITFRGERQYNGVAVASLAKPEAVFCGLGDDGAADEDRLLRVSFPHFTVVNTYVPQGRERETPQFAYKLEWFQRLRRYFERTFSPEENVIWCGDLNVAPDDIDVHNPKRLRGHVCFTPEVWEAFDHVKAWGFVDVFRKHHPGEAQQYTFFDYRTPKSVERELGWRVDHILATAPLAEKSSRCWIDMAPRVTEKPSDHTVVLAEFKFLYGSMDMNNSGETKRVNEAIQETFSRIENSLSAAADVGELIAYVLQELQEAFNIPFAWFSLVDHPETTGWKEILIKSPFLRERLNQIDATTFSELAVKGEAPILANSDLKPFYKLLPQSNKYFIKSIAMAPITMNGAFIGSLNFGDPAPTRYHAEMDTSLLAHLASAVSKNLTDRHAGTDNPAGNLDRD